VIKASSIKEGPKHGHIVEPHRLRRRNQTGQMLSDFLDSETV